MLENMHMGACGPHDGASPGGLLGGLQLAGGVVACRLLQAVHLLPHGLGKEVRLLPEVEVQLLPR